MENLNRELNEKMRRIGFAMRRNFEEKRQANFPDTQNRILTILDMNDGIAQKELAYILGARPQSCGEVISKLESNDYIVKEVDESDKRAHNIYLTEKGREAVKNLQSQRSASVFDVLSEDEKLQLSDLLDKVLAQFPEEIMERRPFERREGRPHGGREEFREEMREPHFERDERREFPQDDRRAHRGDDSFERGQRREHRSERNRGHRGDEDFEMQGRHGCRRENRQQEEHGCHRRMHSSDRHYQF